jgi:hypothetical protein
MTESEWWTATEPCALADWLFFDPFASDRKLRLFAVRCCLAVEHLVRDRDLLELSIMTEAHAGGVVTAAELQDAAQQGWARYVALCADRPYPIKQVPPAHAAFLHAADPQDKKRDRGKYQADEDFPYPSWTALLVKDAIGGTGELQVHLLHDIFGPLPFRDIAADPSWLTSDVLLLARGIYEEKAFDRMPILADALQDAGCNNDDILNHCRAENWEHVRGCWVIDLLLGRPWHEPPAAPT